MTLVQCFFDVPRRKGGRYGRRPCLTPDTIWVQSHWILNDANELHIVQNIGSALIGGGGGEGNKFNTVVH